MKKILDFSGQEPYLFCPRCHSYNILLLSETSHGEQYLCPKCGLYFFMAEAAIWDDENKYIPEWKWRNICTN